MRCAPLVYQQKLYCVVHSTPPGVAGGVDALVAYALANEIIAAVPAAQAEMARLAPLAQPIRLWVSYIVSGISEDTGAPFTRGPYGQAGVHVGITPPGGQTTWTQSDGGANVWLDTTKVGSVALVDLNGGAWDSMRNLHFTFSVNPVTLNLGGNTVTVTANDPGAP
jgi:hypothetical protein